MHTCHFLIAAACTHGKGILAVGYYMSLRVFRLQYSISLSHLMSQNMANISAHKVLDLQLCTLCKSRSLQLMAKSAVAISCV